MLKKELLSKQSRYISEAVEFWGLDHGQNLDDLISRITDRGCFSLHMGKLNIHELRCLYTIFYEGGQCSKVSLDEKFQDEQTFELVLASLEKKLFIYLRKDRRLLTDRYDKIYLFPEIYEVLKSFRIYDSGSLKKYLKNLLPSGITISDEVNNELKEFISYGGIFPVREEEAREFHSLFSEGLIDIILLQEPPIFFPIWIITERVLAYTSKEPENIHFKPNIYLNNIINLIDCLLYKSLGRKSARRIVSTCVKNTIKNRKEEEQYIAELFALNVLEESSGGLEVKGDFAKSSYESKVEYLKSLLTTSERSELGLVKKKKLSSKLLVISTMMIEYVLEHIHIYCIKSREELKKVLDEYNRALTHLIFRGHVVQDFGELYVKASVMEPSIPIEGSVVVNTDREILVYTDSISHFILYVLTGFSHVEHFGPIIRLSIDRDSIARGVEYVCDADLFSQVLQQSVQQELDGTITHLINEWSLSIKSIDLQNCWMIRVDSQDTRLRLYQNKYLQSSVVGETDSFLLLKKDIDIDRLRQEMRKENIFLHIQKA
jgi:hypothetical protein